MAITTKRKRGHQPSGRFAYLDKVTRYNPWTHPDGYTKKKITNSFKTPIRLGSLSDFFALGIICAKLNIEQYARRNLRLALQDGSDRDRLFRKGIADSDQYTTDDIAMEVFEIREYGEEMFDRFIEQCAGRDVLRDMLRAIERCKADPWDSLNTIEGRGKRTGKSTYKNNIGKPDICRILSIIKPPIEGAA